MSAFFKQLQEFVSEQEKTKANAVELWRWLPSFGLACSLHGAKVLDHAPSVAKILDEACEVLDHLDLYGNKAKATRLCEEYLPPKSQPPYESNVEEVGGRRRVLLRSY